MTDENISMRIHRHESAAVRRCDPVSLVDPAGLAPHLNLFTDPKTQSGDWKTGKIAEKHIGHNAQGYVIAGHSDFAKPYTEPATIIADMRGAAVKLLTPEALAAMILPELGKRRTVYLLGYLVQGGGRMIPFKYKAE